MATPRTSFHDNGSDDQPGDYSILTKWFRLFMSHGPQGNPKGNESDTTESRAGAPPSIAETSRFPSWIDSIDSSLSDSQSLTSRNSSFFSVGHAAPRPTRENGGLTETELFAKKLQDNRQGRISLAFPSRSGKMPRQPLGARSLLAPSRGERLVTAAVLRPKASFVLPISKNVRPENTAKYDELHANKIRLLEQIKTWRKEHELKTQLPPVKHVEPLEPQAKAVVDRYWRSGKKHDVVGEVYRVQLSVADIQTLRPRSWLNDNVIDAYLADNSTKTKKKTFAFTTHFYSRLEQSGYPAVKKWAKRKKVDILDLDYLVVPVNRGNMHWCMSVVDFNKKKISFYDSLSSRGGKDVVDKLVDYLVQEADQRYPGEHDKHAKLFESFELLPTADCPQQDNGFDCGVFACQAALRVSNDDPMDFDQADMNIIRERMAFNLLKLAGVQ